jgi:hypothetical protein
MSGQAAANSHSTLPSICFARGVGDEKILKKLKLWPDMKQA